MRHWLEANARSKQTLQLNVRRARDHDHAVAQSFTTSFIKKRDICEKEFGRVAMRLRFGAPATANAGMENFFERGFPFRARKDYGAKSLAIQVVTARINVR